MAPIVDIASTAAVSRMYAPIVTKTLCGFGAPISLGREGAMSGVSSSSERPSNGARSVSSRVHTVDSETAGSRAPRVLPPLDWRVRNASGGRLGWSSCAFAGALIEK
eukprot:Amastigsp_a3486_15.p6 type:complete len:107 gc:universal Amastigsp_a3486_15:1291-1611(+)